MKEQYKKLHEENKKRVQQIHHDFKEKQKKDVEILNKKIEETNEKIDILASNVEDQLFRRIDNKLGSQIKEMRKDIFQLYENIKKLKVNFKNQN